MSSLTDPWRNHHLNRGFHRRHHQHPRTNPGSHRNHNLLCCLRSNPVAQLSMNHQNQAQNHCHRPNLLDLHPDTRRNRNQSIPYCSSLTVLWDKYLNDLKLNHHHRPCPHLNLDSHLHRNLLRYWKANSDYRLNNYLADQARCHCHHRYLRLNLGNHRNHSQ